MVSPEMLDHAARGFTLNDVQPAVYSGDCWRAWGMVQGERVGKNPSGFTGYECDLFVTPKVSQKLSSSGLLRGTGRVYCWDPAERRWLKPEEFTFRPNPRYFVKVDGGRNDWEGYAYRTDLAGSGYTRYYRKWSDILATVRNSRTKDRPW
jgi:hypothetical protein